MKHYLCEAKLEEISIQKKEIEEYNLICFFG